jgi:spermidine synthase
MAPFSVSLAILFFLSGASALIYQVLWLRLLGLVFGVTIHAATTVLASFMGGLAIGSLVAGRLAPRVRRPLLWFGAAEILIGLAALGTQPALRAVMALYVGAGSALADSPVLLTALRFAGASLVLLVPTAMMGASLPLVLQSSLARDPRVGERFAALYAANTSGAIAGTCLVGFVLIERIGISASFVLAALGNFFVGLSAIGMSRMVPAEGVPRHASASGAPAPRPAGMTRLLIVFALSGFAALAFEIVWFRLLVLFVPATTYAFSTMLAAVLFGIAAGSALAPPLLSRVRDHRRLLAGIEIGIGFAAMLSLIALAATYRAGWQTSGTIQASLLTIAPTTILMGLAFPIGVRLLTEGRADASQATARVAVLYAVNVAGAIAGATAAGFLLIPSLGTTASLALVAAVHVVAGLMLLDTRRLLVAAAVAIAFAAIAWRLPDPVTTVIGRRHPASERVWWREEGAQSTVSVHVRPGSGRQTLYLDGLHQANDSPEMVRVHQEIGLLPMLLHPDPRRVLVVGLGAGATAGAVTHHPGAEVTLVELSPSVVRAAAFFENINNRIFDRPHVRITINDARNHLLLSKDRYDVITADIIQPIHAGAGNLYSREYFELVRGALAEGGLAMQWIGHREATPYALIMRTFLAAFPHATLWSNGTLMIGSRQPLRLDPASIARKLTLREMQRVLADLHLDSVDAILGDYTAGPDEMRAFVGDGPILTDDRPRIEYYGSLPENEGGADLRHLKGDVRTVIR